MADAFTKELEASIESARNDAILGKKQNPSWIQLMDHIDKAFNTFNGIKGYYNIKNHQWAVVMTDSAKAHTLLRDYLSKYVGVMAVREFSSGMMSWTEALDWVAFEISNRCEYVNVRSTYYKSDERYDVDLTHEEKEAIRYRIETDVVPFVKQCIYDEFPYQEKPRLVTSLTNIENTFDNLNALYESGHYDSSAQGHFSYLVYRLKGMSIFESVTEFNKWLNEDDSE